MAMGSLDRDTVNLVPGQLIMEESQDMPIIFMTNWRLKKHRFDSRKNGLRLVIIMKRKIISEMMTTYLPSTLLVAITFATTFFKPFIFEAALSVNLTTMLVMTNIFISKMEILPPSSDIKMIDIWLILCQLVPFAQEVLLTAMEYIREGSLDEKGTDQQIWAGKEKEDKIVVIEKPVEDNKCREPQNAWMQENNQEVRLVCLAKLLIIGKLASLLF